MHYLGFFALLYFIQGAALAYIINFQIGPILKHPTGLACGKIYLSCS